MSVPASMSGDGLGARFTEAGRGTRAALARSRLRGRPADKFPAAVFEFTGACRLRFARDP
ncbi:MAG TPA: hypothetical protein VG942_10710 [Hyphomonadaceae bacterium]|nr:hypothetical protein [Hyphomonadaceae bacterium]